MRKSLWVIGHRERGTFVKKDYLLPFLEYVFLLFLDKWEIRDFTKSPD